MDLEVFGTEELALDAIQAQQQKKGKWRTDATLAVEDGVFLNVIARLCHVAREPLHHFFRWLEKPLEARDIDGLQVTPSKVALLVWFKGEKFLAELEALTFSQRWAQFFSLIPAHLHGVLSECIQTLTLLHLADFDRRVMYLIVRRYPQRVLLICKRGPHIKCQTRLAVAKEILEADDAKLEINMRKLRCLYSLRKFHDVIPWIKLKNRTLSPGGA